MREMYGSGSGLVWLLRRRWCMGRGSSRSEGCRLCEPDSRCALDLESRRLGDDIVSSVSMSLLCVFSWSLLCFLLVSGEDGHMWREERARWTPDERDRVDVTSPAGY